MNRRNIVQYKPKGPANIFAPTIRINGKNHQYKPYSQAPLPSNLSDLNLVDYPQQPTVNSSRMLNYQTGETNNHFNNLYSKLFDNLFENSEGIDSVTASNNSSSEFQTFSNLLESNNPQGMISRLSGQIDCLSAGNTCVNIDDCPQANITGNCLAENTVCCKSSQSGVAQNASPFTSSFGSQPSTQQSSSSSSTSQQSSSTQQSSSSQQSSSGTSQQSQTQQSSQTQNAFGGNNRPTSVFGDYDAKGGDSWFCKNNCKRVVSDTVTDTDGNLKTVNPYYKWMDCTPGCKEYECNNCPDTEFYKDPTDLDGNGTDIPNVEDTNDSELKKKILEYRKQLGLHQASQTRFLDLKPQQLSSEDKCYAKNQYQCNTDPNCFYCISNEGPQKTCYKVNEKDYVCDYEATSACVPLYKQGNEIKDDTTGPFYRFERYDKDNENKNSMGYISRDVKLKGEGNGNFNVLNYPRQCKGPIKETLSRNELEQQLRNQNKMSNNVARVRKTFQG